MMMLPGCREWCRRTWVRILRVKRPICDARAGVRIDAIVPAFITRVGLFVDADAALVRDLPPCGIEPSAVPWQ